MSADAPPTLEELTKLIHDNVEAIIAKCDECAATMDRIIAKLEADRWVK